jgi:hypothetical protein
MELQLSKEEQQEILARREAKKKAIEETKKQFGERNEKAKAEVTKKAEMYASYHAGKHASKYDFVKRTVDGINELAEEKGLGKVFSLKTKYETYEEGATYTEKYIDENGKEQSRHVSIEKAKCKYPVATVSSYLGKTPNSLQYPDEKVTYSLSFETILSDSYIRPVVKGHKVKIDGYYNGLPGTYSQRGYKSPKTILETILEDIEALDIKKDVTAIRDDFRKEQTVKLKKLFPGAEVSKGYVKNHYDTLYYGEPCELFEVKTDNARIIIQAKQFEDEELHYSLKDIKIYNEDLDIIDFMKKIL